MMIFAGNRWAIWTLLLLLAVASTQAFARVTVTADRNDVALGETLRLIIKADAGEQPDELDLTQLERDFEILQRSSATSARIVGGEQSVTRTLELELAPRRDGLLTVPSFDYEGRRTTPIAIKVNPQPDVALDDELVYFDAKVDRSEVYVQAQAILTITLQQAINLDNRAVSELEIPNTYVEALEQKSFQRRAGGRLWQVTELRYALFPQQSGSMEIPAITFSGRELLPGRSLLGARLGRRIALESKPITINVKPVPASFPGDVWLPARQLKLDSRWSTPPEQLAIGDSTTRTIEITAEGLQGSQLPPITSLGSTSGVSGLRFYPDQETVEQREVAMGIEGYRLQSEALVATEAGQWQLPELVVPWWNTETDTLEYARLPATAVAVAGAAVLGSGADDPALTSPSGQYGLSDATPGPIWLGVGALGWILAAVFAGLLWHQRGQSHRGGPANSRVSAVPSIGNRELVPLRLACSENNARAARDALLIWGQRYLQSDMPPTLSQLAQRFPNELGNEIRRLDAALFGPEGEHWRGDALFKQVRDQSERPPTDEAPVLALYPAA